MIIGFLGKGGSGKTTLATMYTKYLLDKGSRVLALDNDHNMDFKYNLGYEGDMTWMGGSLQDIFEEVAITSTKEIVEVEQEFIFSLNPKDKVTEKYTVDISDNLSLMVAGPHTADMMYGNMCSHGLTTPLKVYLPLLKLNDNEYVIVDEKAGTDGVGTGVTTGFNAALVVAEATPHGVKSAKQIIDMLRFYKTPFVVAVNKVRDAEDSNKYDGEFFTEIEKGEELENLILHFNFDIDAVDLKLSDNDKKEFEKLFNWTQKLNDNRKERTKMRIQKQKDYNEAKSNQ